MILIFGGIYQGKRTFATDTLGLTDEQIISQEEVFDSVKNWVDEAETEEEINSKITAFVARAMREDRAVIVNDISQGIVPMDPSERKIREANGRLLIGLAREAESVYRLFCGIADKLK